ncbi:MAG: M28 family peptidase, partial [Fulvivirga sp.]|nr:M28 family peptidase [Fulvivirga sp.]
DYDKNKDYKGKVLIARAGSVNDQSPNSLYGMARTKRDLAIKAGAVAFIEFHTFDNAYWHNVTRYLGHESFGIADQDKPSVDMPHIWVKSKLPDNKQVDIKLKVEGISRSIVTSSNVVGMVEGTDPELKDEFIIYSAHYDHVGVGAPNAEGDSIYNGARDNAVGTVTVLSAAENIAKYPTKRSALFILFTAEEKGLLGSQYYVEHPLLPLDQMVYCFNSDNASYNDTSKATIVGLNRTTAEDHIKEAAQAFGLTAINDPAPEQNLFDRSDNVHFAKKGIPAPTFSLGFTAFDAEVFKYYHQPSDNPDNVDYDYLTKFFRAYVLSCRNIANAEQTPFWVEGDKYFEAGKALYQK